MLQFSAQATSSDTRLTTVSAIAQEMVRVMQELTQPDPDGEAPPPARACVMNIVLVGQDEATVQEASKVAAQLSAHYPSRTFVVTAAPAQAEASLDGSVSAFCSLRGPGTKELVCLEQVWLKATGATARHLAGIILPLLTPDLPVYLWWIGEPPEQSELLQSCDRIIVDSTGFKEPLPQLARLHVILQQQNNRRGNTTSLSDFTWLRLGPWRELIAQFFDGPETVPYVHQLTNVRVEYGTDPGGTAHASPSLLLLGWLAAKLGWQYREGSSRARGRDYRLSFAKPDGSPVSLQVVPRARASESGYPGEILSIELTALVENREAVFSVNLHQDGIHASTRTLLPGLRETTRTVPMERNSMEDLLLEGLESMGNDASFEESLAVTAAMLP